MTRYQLTDAERTRTERIDQLVVLGDVDELIESLADSSWTVRRAAVAGLASLGDEAVGPLCTWLGDRRATENAIAAAVDALVARLSLTVSFDPNEAGRYTAAQIAEVRKAVSASIPH